MKRLYTMSMLSADEPATGELLDFLGRLFRGMTADHWRWEYRGSPGAADVHLAHYDGRLIGHYAVIRIPFQVGATPCLGAKAEGSLIDLEAVKRIPQDSDRRVFLELVRRTLKGAEGGVIFGFPNRPALNTQVKGGYKVVELPLINAKCIRRIGCYFAKRGGRRAKIAKLIAPLFDIASRAWIATRARKTSAIRSISAADGERLEAFAKALGEIFPTIVSTRRNWEYLRWRYIENPYAPATPMALFGASGSILALIALSIAQDGDRRIGQIQDVVALDAEAMDQVLRWALAWLREVDADALEVWTMDTAAYRFLNDRLRINGFWFQPKGAPKKMIVHSTVGDQPYAAENWYVSKSFQRY